MTARTGPEEHVPEAKPLRRKEARPGAGAFACVSAVLAAFAALSSSMLVSTTSSEQYSMGAFEVSSVRLAATSNSGNIVVVSGTSTFRSVGDTACVDETVNVTIAGTGTTLVVNNYQDWGHRYGFCDEPGSSAQVPLEASLIEAFVILLVLFALTSTLLLCGTFSFKRRSRPFSIASITSACGGLCGVVALAEIATWTYTSDLRAGIAWMPVQVGENMYALETQSSFSFGTGFVGLVASTILAFVTAFYALCVRNDLRRDFADEEDVLPPIPGLDYDSRRDSMYDFTDDVKSPTHRNSSLSVV